MTAVVLTGHGGFDKLEVRTDVAVPVAGPGQVLIKVGAAGVNNADINTRTGWYAKSVTQGSSAGGDGGFESLDDDADGSWSGGFSFPRIQGADCCGEIVAVGDGVDAARIGERVVVRTMQVDYESDSPVGCVVIGSEYDGAFAEFSAVPAIEAVPVTSDWTDVELASLPCAYSTAEGMIATAEVTAGQRVLVTGASGGVGVATVQLCKVRGADVVAVCGAAKADAVRALGADEVLARDADLVAELGESSVDVVLDVVGGPGFPALLTVLRPGGTYGTVGAIAGPIVDLDLRDLYLKDLTLRGTTFQAPEHMDNVVRYVENGDLEPAVALTFPLTDIVAAQEAFLAKDHVGKIVLVP